MVRTPKFETVAAKMNMPQAKMDAITKRAVQHGKKAIALSKNKPKGR